MCRCCVWIRIDATICCVNRLWILWDYEGKGKAFLLKIGMMWESMNEESYWKETFRLDTLCKQVWQLEWTWLVYYDCVRLLLPPFTVQRFKIDENSILWHLFSRNQLKSTSLLYVWLTNFNTITIERHVNSTYHETHATVIEYQN